MGKYTEVEYFINKNFFLYSLMKEIVFSVYTFFFVLDLLESLSCFAAIRYLLGLDTCQW